MEQKQTVNKMGTEPVKRLLLTMGVPMMLSMAVQALYNIVDSYFVSCMPDTDKIQNMGDYAVNALTLSFPIQMLMVAIGVGLGVGINAILSKSLGEGNREKAGKISGNAVFIGICMYILFLIFGFFGIDIYLKSQTSNPVVLELGKEYLQICTFASFGIAMYMIYEKLLQATGRTGCATIAQITGAVTNMVLDPVMIFGYFGCPRLGIQGAAYATVIGQIVSFLMDMIFHYKFNKKDFDNKLSYLRPEGKVLKEIFQVGVPAIFMQALMSFMTYGVNIIFGAVSLAAVTAYGVYYKIQQFVFFAAFGMNNAMIPIIGFNYGMQDRKRVKDGIKYGMLYTLIIMLIGAVGLQLFAVQISGFFSISAHTQILCIRAIRIITLGFLFVGANIAYQGIFQALGYGVSSLIVSLLRLLVVTLPLAWVFTKFSDPEKIIWAAFPIAEGVAFVMAVFIMKIISKQKIDQMKTKSVKIITQIQEPAIQ